MSYSPQNVTRADVVRESGILSQVYAWMTAGLLVTGAVAMYVASTPALFNVIAGNSITFFGLIIAEVAMVWILVANIERMSSGLATTMFMAYSGMNGLTLSVIFSYYTQESIATTFFVTAGTFAVMSLYGYTTKQDLTRVGNILIMALIGFLIASVVNIFLGSELLYWITTFAGIIIFVGLVAWDTQKIKRMIAQHGSEQTRGRIAILGALMLYLDFVNLFLLLLRLLGNRD
jgi:hypothetical protein